MSERCQGCGRDPDAYVLDSEYVRVCQELKTREAQLLIANRVADGVMDTNRMFQAAKAALKEANALLTEARGEMDNPLLEDRIDAHLERFGG